MYTASQTMELGSESTFTGLVLFHRYVRQFYHLVANQKQHQQRVMQIKKHLGLVAAACLFVGCKMEEEPRRIRDVINLSHVLGFSSWEDDDGGGAVVSSTDNPEKNTLGEEQNHQQLSSSAKETPIKQINIVESNHPPLLDESYWTAKEQMVSTEQHVLRMISFDTTVCHPHRCVLIVMETLGFGVGKSSTNDNPDNNHWLLSDEKSEHLILRSWRIINEAVLDPRGEALKYPVIVLSCAAISLAADGVGVSNLQDCSENDIGRIKLPDYWWRALDVSTKDITTLRNVLQF